MPNQTIKFKKKAYNESTDSGAGIVVFDTSKHKVYVGGVCYSSDVADASYNGENRKLSITKRDGSSTSIDIPDILSSTIIRIYRNLTGTAGTSTNPYNHAKWDVTDETITEYVDGMVVSLKVPVAGLLKYGVGFQINNLGYKPVVYNVNTTIGTRYGVGSVVWCQYNSTQTATLYEHSSSASTITGCWQIMDYGVADTDKIGYQLKTNTSIRPTLTRTRHNRILFSNPDNTKWIPANTGYDNSATSQKTVNQNPINPFGRIVYCESTSNFAAGANVTATVTWDQYTLALGYSFNTTGAALTLTYPAPVYVKCAPQADGSAIIDSTQPYVQVLPSTNDGKIYIYLGQAYSATNIELEINHPVFYHDGGGIRVWTGATPESDLFDCVMTRETVDSQTVWSCDHTWDEIYAAHQAGKFVRLFEGVSDMYMPVVISNNSGVFSTCTHLSLGTLSESSFINSFWYDEGTWSYHAQNFKAFTDTYKSKLDGIAAGAEVNVQADWNQSDNTADDYIKNKPTIPTVNNKTITIQKNGTTVDSFTTNASSNKTINITGVQDQITSTNKLSADLISDGDTNKVFTATEQSKLSGIAAGAEINVQADWNQTTNTADDYIKNKPTIPTVNNKTITIQKNGTTVDSFTTNASANKTINITVPTSAADVSALPSSTKYAASIDLSINSTTYVVTAQLKDQDGNNLGTADTIDLPLESVVVNGSYNNSTKKVVLTLQSGSTVEFSVADLVSGLQSEITSTNKLSADLITDGNTNKVFTSTEKTKLSGIAEGAEVNVQADWNQTTASADDYIKNKPTIPTVNDSTITIQKNGTTVDTFTTNASSAKTINITGVQDEITSSNKLSADLISDGTTNKVFTATEKTKLAGIEAGAQVNVQADWNQTTTTADDYIKNKPNVNEDFVCNFTMTIDTESSEDFPDNCLFTCDKRVQEIITAINSGKNIVGRCVYTNPDDNTQVVHFNANICTSISGVTGVEPFVMFDVDLFFVFYQAKFNLLGVYQDANTDVWGIASVLTNNDIGNVRNLKPVATSGTLNSLGDVDVWDASNGDIISYNSTSGIWENKQFPVSDWNQSDSTADDFIKNKPTIPTTTSQLTNNSGFITANDVPQELFKCNISYQVVDGQSVYSCDKTWSEIYAAHQSGKLVVLFADSTVFTPNVIQPNGGSFESDRYSYFEGVGGVYYTSNLTYSTNEWKFIYGAGYVFSQSYKEKLDGIAAGAEVNVQADWNQSDSTADDYIKNKPNFSDIPITYSELKSLRDNGELVPKQTYRITDYVTMITPYIVNYVSLSTTEPATDEICEYARVSPEYKQYDILVTAIDESHLSEDCRMAKHGNETYFDNLDLPSWRIKYSLDNDRSKYDWAMDYYTGTVVVDNSAVDVTIVKWLGDGKEVSGTTMFSYVILGSDTDDSDSDVHYTRTPAYSEDSTLAARSVLQIDGSPVVLDTCTHHTGKGVVYHMEDMNSNKLSYDYVNIQFKEYAPSGFSSNMDENYSIFETSELRDEIFYSAQNDVYDRFLNFYSSTGIFGSGQTHRFDIDYNNFDWYYTFDQYDATNGTHTNVFTKCYDNIIGPTYNACFNVIGTGVSVYILPYNVYQFREGFLERFTTSSDVPFGKIPFFVSGVRYSNNILGNVFMYSSSQDMSSFLENDTSRIVNPIKSDTILVGCAFKNCSNIKANTSNGYFLKSHDLDIQGGMDALVYDSHSVKVGTSSEKITLYDSSNILCGTETSRLEAYASSGICMGDCCYFHGVNAHNVYMGDDSVFITTDDNESDGNTNNIHIGSGASVQSVKKATDIHIGNRSFVSCIQGASNISVGVCCNDISICSPDYGGIQKVKIGDFCTNVRIGTTENPMRCENCTIEENVSFLNLYNSNADYLDLYSADVLKNLTVNKSYTIGNYNWLNVNGVPLNDIYNKKIGFNSNRVAVLYVEEDLIKQNPPTLSAITFGTDDPYLLVYFNGDEMMYGTNDGTTPSPNNYAYRVSRATTGHDYYQFAPVAGTTYKFVRYSSTDPFATSPIATYQA